MKLTKIERKTYEIETFKRTTFCEFHCHNHGAIYRNYRS